MRGRELPGWYRRAGTVLAEPSDPRNHRRLILAALGVLVVVAVALRVDLLPFQSTDFLIFRRWYGRIDQLGIASFGHPISNYSPPYLYVLYVATILPLPAIVAIKGSMILFDFLLAGSVYRLVGVFRPARYAPALAAIATLFLPTVFLNSAFWAQIDATYTAFLVLSLHAALTGRGGRAWTYFGVAIAIKLQAVFFLPVLLFLAVTRIGWRRVWRGVLAFVVLTFPPVLFGRPVRSLLDVYLTQGTMFHHSLTLRAPSIYQWFPRWTYLYFNRAGVWMTAAAVLFVLVVGLVQRKFGQEELLVLSALVLVVVPFLLPHMHERYFYPAEILFLVLAFVVPRYAWVAVLMQVISFFTYSSFLFHRRPVPFAFLTLGVLVIICALSALYVRTGEVGRAGRHAQRRDPLQAGAGPAAEGVVLSRRS
ncbi:MAG: hypothetical protein WCA46_07770 [Actinocatenispora sp.]